MTSMTVGKSQIDLLEDRVEALEKKLADQERSPHWYFGTPMYPDDMIWETVSFPPNQPQSKTE